MHETPKVWMYQGARYSFRGMSGESEIRILRRLSPFVAGFLRTHCRPSSKPGIPFEMRRELDVLKLIASMFDAYGALSDADTDLIERACLGATVREVDGAWMPVWPEGEPGPAFPDLDGLMRLRIVALACGRVVAQWFTGSDVPVPTEVSNLIRILH